MVRLRFVLLIAVAQVMAAGSNPAPAPPQIDEIVKIDVHSHILEPVPEFVDMMRRINLRIINICVRGTIPQWLPRAEQLVEDAHRNFPDLFAFASTFDVTRRGEEDYHDQVRNWLDRSFEAGAVMTKIWKEIGMEVKKPDGSFLMPDDAVFDPIYEHLRQRGKPLIAHLGEPIEAWQPLHPDSTHYGYYSNHPEWHFYTKEGVPSHQKLIAARDRILEKHPGLTVIGAHLGSLSHDVDEVARRLDRFPNFYVEVAARTKDLTRQPKEKVRNFFIQYQDRILYGYDLGFAPKKGGRSQQEIEAFVRRAEAQYRGDFQYYAGSGTVEMAGREVECLELPRPVLEKFYNGNARRIIPGLGL